MRFGDGIFWAMFVVLVGLTVVVPIQILASMELSQRDLRNASVSHKLIQYFDSALDEIDDLLSALVDKRLNGASLESVRHRLQGIIPPKHVGDIAIVADGETVIPDHSIKAPPVRCQTNRQPTTGSDKIDTLIGPPQFDKLSQRWFVQIYQCLQASSGKEETYYAFYFLDDFVDFYRGFSTGSDQSMLLSNSDGISLVRVTGSVIAHGIDIQRGILLSRTRQEKSGRYFGISTIDGVRRSVHFAVSERYPAFVAVGLAYDYYQKFQSLLYTLAAAVLIGASLIFGGFILKRLMRSTPVKPPHPPSPPANDSRGLSGQTLVSLNELIRILSNAPGAIVAMANRDGHFELLRPRLGDANQREAAIVTHLQINFTEYLRSPDRAFIDRFGEGDDEFELWIVISPIVVPHDTAFPFDHLISVIDGALKGVHRNSLHQMTKLGGLGQLTIYIAHELAQRISVIMLAAENGIQSFGTETPDPYVQDRLQSIVTQAARASSLIEKIRTYGRSRDESRNQFDVWTCIESIRLMFAEQFTAIGIELTTSKTGQALVFGHSSQIEQVLINVMSNARDAIELSKRDNSSHQGAVHINYEARGQDIRISIEDNGAGFDSITQESIFEPFFTTKPPGKGTGLGLSIAETILRRHGGSIKGERVGDWTRFTITLPTVGHVQVHENALHRH